MNVFDQAIYNYINSFNSSLLTDILIVITNFAHAITFIVFTIILIFCIRNRRIGKYIASNLTLVFLLNQILKIIIARPRPYTNSIVEEMGYSFPSAHAMVSFGYYGFLIYLVYKNIENKKIKIPLITLLSLLIIFIGISRIYLGVHYATDVLGGFVIAFIYLVIFIKFIYERRINNE